jgi:hypothetical protein
MLIRASTQAKLDMSGNTNARIDSDNNMRNHQRKYTALNLAIIPSLTLYVEPK